MSKRHTADDTGATIHRRSTSIAGLTSMRIAIYHNLTSGGAKRSLFEQSKRLATRHTIDVYSLSTANHEFADLRPWATKYTVFSFKPLPLLNSPFGRLNQIIRWLDLLRIKRINRAIAAKIEAQSYDVLFVHPCQFENSPSLLKFVARLPKVIWFHEPLRLLYEEMPARPYDLVQSPRRKLLNELDPLPALYRGELRRNDQNNLKYANRVLVNSEFIRSAVKRIYQVDPVVNYLGVDASLFRPLGMEKLGYVFSVGSLTPLKGFDFLIEATSLLPVSERPAFVIASNFSSPQEKEYLLALAGNKSIVLHLLENVSDSRLVELYNQAAVTLYAPIREPFGFVSLETMACETPVIAVREGGIQETVVHQQTGLLVERDREEFADGISQLMKDSETADRFGKAGRAHVLQNWTWERSVDELEKLLSF